MARPSKAAFIVTAIILLIAISYLVRIYSPTGRYLGIKPCVDMDGGEDPFVFGFAHDLSGRSIFDECKDFETVNEAYCQHEFYARQIPISCPIGQKCDLGVCRR